MPHCSGILILILWSAMSIQTHHIHQKPDFDIGKIGAET